MSPRNSSQGKVEKWAYDIYQQQRRILSTGPYMCPKCAKNSLAIVIDKRRRLVHGKCGCGHVEYVKFYDAFQPIDYYNKIIDKSRSTTNV
jgi:transcription elongation factor Elf1